MHAAALGNGNMAKCLKKMTARIGSVGGGISIRPKESGVTKQRKITNIIWPRLDLEIKFILIIKI